MKSWKTGCAVLVALGALFGCASDDDGESSVTVGAELEDSASAPRVCVRLPVLLGSQTAASTSVDGAFDMDVRALRHNVHIDFPGALNADEAARTLSLSQLLTGYAEVVTVNGSDGVDYDVLLRSGCQETASGNP